MRRKVAIGEQSVRDLSTFFTMGNGLLYLWLDGGWWHIESSVQIVMPREFNRSRKEKTPIQTTVSDMFRGESPLSDLVGVSVALHTSTYSFRVATLLLVLS